MTAEERKHKSEENIQSYDLPINKHLPIIEEEHEAKIRNADEIAKRILILAYLSYMIEEPDDKQNIISCFKQEK